MQCIMLGGLSAASRGLLLPTCRAAPAGQISAVTPSVRVQYLVLGGIPWCVWEDPSPRLFYWAMQRSAAALLLAPWQVQMAYCCP